MRASRDDVLALLRHESSGVLVDCRTRAEYEGTAAPRDGVAVAPQAWSPARGHLPGALHLPPEWLLDRDGALLPADELAARAAAFGLTRDRPVTAYCHMSERSALTWLALSEVLGFPEVRVYDGGWWEYSHLVDVPPARGGGEPVAAGAPASR